MHCTTLVVFYFTAAGAMLAALNGCAGRVESPGAAKPIGAFAAFPAITEVVHSSSAAPLLRDGSGFMPPYSNRVSAAGLLGRFAPNFVDSSTLADLAYGTYEFNGGTLSGSATIEAHWQLAPPAATAYLALSDWDNGRWEWFSLGTSLIALSVIERYIHDGDGRILAIVAVTGTAAADLAKLQLTVGAEEPHWRATQLSVTPGKIKHLRLFELEGRPAVTYWRDGLDEVPPTSRIVLKRALDPLGETWGAPQVIRDVPQSDTYIGIVNELIPLFAEDRLGLMIEEEGYGLPGGVNSWYTTIYLYASDPGATSFGPAQIVHHQDEGEPVLMDASVFSERPVMLGYNDIVGILWMTHASDTAGTSWTTVEVDGYEGGEINPYGLLSAGGLAAALYPFNVEVHPSVNLELRFRHAADAEISAWSPFEVVVPAPGGAVLARPVSLADGRPAFVRGSGSAWVFWSATDLLGETWPAAGTAISSMDNISSITVEQVFGVPALAYTRSDPEALHFRTSADATGANWEPAELVSAGTFLQAPSLAEIAGYPAIVTVLDASGDSGYPVFFIYR